MAVLIAGRGNVEHKTGGVWVGEQEGMVGRRSVVVVSVAKNT